MTDDQILKGSMMSNLLPVLARIEIRLWNFISGRNSALGGMRNGDREIPTLLVQDGKRQGRSFNAQATSNVAKIPHSPKSARFCRPRCVDQRSTIFIEYTRSNLG
jgi:hypothetical protein